MRTLLLGSALIALCLGSSTSFAASVETDAFVGNVRVNADFLDQASILASDRSENTDLRTFAGKEAPAMAAVLSDLDARSTPDVAARAMPVTVASNDVLTGRSVAVDRASEAAAVSPPSGTGALMPAAAITLDRLSASKGLAFDTLYKATQVNALRQLAALYDAYVQTGDDAALRQLAKSELAATNDRLADIARF